MHDKIELQDNEKPHRKEHIVTLQLPPKETHTIIVRRATGEKVLAVKEYSVVRVGNGRATHLGNQVTYSDGRKRHFITECGAVTIFTTDTRRNRAYKVNADDITCKRCQKSLYNLIY